MLPDFSIAKLSLHGLLLLPGSNWSASPAAWLPWLDCSVLQDTVQLTPIAVLLHTNQLAIVYSARSVVAAVNSLAFDQVGLGKRRAVPTKLSDIKHTQLRLALTPFNNNNNLQEHSQLPFSFFCFIVCRRSSSKTHAFHACHSNPAIRGHWQEPPRGSIYDDEWAWIHIWISTAASSEVHTLHAHSPKRRPFGSSRASRDTSEISWRLEFHESANSVSLYLYSCIPRLGT